MGSLRSIKGHVVVIIAKFFIVLLMLFVTVTLTSFVLVRVGVLVSNNLEYSVDWDKLTDCDSVSKAGAYIEQRGLDYGIFDKKGNIITGRWLDNKFFAVENFVDSDRFDIYGVHYRLFRCRDFDIVIRFPTIVNFASHELRRKFNYNTVSIYLLVIISFMTFLIYLYKFFKLIDSEFKNIITVTMSDEIVEQNSKVKEFNSSMTKINDMKRELKTLLQKEKDYRQNLSFQISALTHDIKTPLTVIKGNAELLEMSNLDENQLEFTKSVVNASKIIDEYVDTMVSHTKLIYAENDYSNVDITELIENILQETAGYSQKNVNLKFEIDETVPKTISCVQSNVKRAVTNLLINAYDYAKSEIFINVYRAENYLCISVWNDGSSISDDVLDKVSSPFYMQESGRNVGKHYGLGLYFANDVAIKHDGKLEVKNQHGGVEVIIKLFIR